MKEFLYEKAEQALVEKEFDPAKSTSLAQWSASEFSGIFRTDTETLYVSGKGEYFILYEGGMHSRFHELPGVETWFGGSYIRPVTVSEAVAWCEETGNYEVLDRHFPYYRVVARRGGPGKG